MLMMTDSIPGLKPYTGGKMKPPKPRKPRAPNAHSRRHSVYWTYFAFMMDEDGSTNKKVVVCRLCGQSYSFSGNTTNLKSHLSRFHKTEYGDLELKNPGAHKTGPAPRGTPLQDVPTIQASQMRGSNGSSDNITTIYVMNQPSEMTSSALLTWLIVDLMPIHSVTGDGFRRLLTSCSPNLEIPVPGDIAASIGKVYDEELLKIIEEVKSVSSLAVGVETWSISASEHYVTVRGFWVTENWESRCKVLSTRPIADKDDDTQMAQLISTCLQECQILLQKVTCVVAVPSATMEKAVVHLELPLVPCLAYVLNQALDTAIGNTAQVSALIQRIFTQQQHEGGSGAGIGLVSEASDGNNIGKSWVTKYAVLSKNAEHAHGLSEFMFENDYAVVKEADAFFQPFKLASDGLCSEKYPIASMLLPLLYRLLNKTDTITGNLAKMLHQRVTSQTKPFWDKPQVGKILNTVSFFDPRIKTLPHLTPIQRQEVAQYVESEVALMMDGLADGGTQLMIGAGAAKANSPGGGDKLGSLLGGLFDETPNFGTSSSASQVAGQHIQEEIDKYSLEQRLNTSCSPLEWWRAHGSHYPLLAKVARKYLCISCTSVPASWVLTEQGETILYKRGGLESDYRDKLVFLHENVDLSSDG